LTDISSTSKLTMAGSFFIFKSRSNMFKTQTKMIAACAGNTHRLSFEIKVQDKKAEKFRNIAKVGCHCINQAAIVTMLSNNGHLS
jgi:hypothetical protein